LYLPCAFVAAFVTTFLGMSMALDATVRAATAPWPQRARAAFPARIVGKVAVALVPAAFAMISQSLNGPLARIPAMVLFGGSWIRPHGRRMGARKNRTIDLRNQRSHDHDEAVRILLVARRAERPCDSNESEPLLREDADARHVGLGLRVLIANDVGHGDPIDPPLVNHVESLGCENDVGILPGPRD
jgi:hypothetical protein